MRTIWANPLEYKKMLSNGQMTLGKSVTVLPQYHETL